MKSTTRADYRERVLRVSLHLQEHLDELPSLEQLAHIACFSPFHFHRIFRGITGESVQAHVRRLRLERAARHLLSTDRGVLEVALDAGYGSPEAFSRAFKASFGATPSQFRETRRAATSSAPAPREREAMQVIIEDLEKTHVAFVRHVGPYEACGRAWKKLLPRLGREGWLGAGARIFGLCYDDPEVTAPEKVRYDACVAVDERFEASGDIGVQVIPGGPHARVTHEGPYETLSESYSWLIGEWLPSSGRTPRDRPCLEFYLNDPESTPAEELLTDLYLPLEA